MSIISKVMSLAIGVFFMVFIVHTFVYAETTESVNELEAFIHASVVEKTMQIRSAQIEALFNKNIDRPMRVEVVDLFAVNIVLRFVFDSSVLTEDDIFSFIEERSESLTVTSFMAPTDNILYVSLTPIETIASSTPFGGDQQRLTDPHSSANSAQTVPSSPPADTGNTGGQTDWTSWKLLPPPAGGG